MSEQVPRSTAPRIWSRYARLLATALACVACGVSDSKNVADLVAEQYFEAVRAQDLDQALTLYHAEFFDHTPDTTWSKMLGRIHEKLGTLESFEQINWNVGVTTGQGTLVTLVYSVQYSKYPATEQLTLKKSRDGTAFHIVGHHINSQGLLLE